MTYTPLPATRLVQRGFRGMRDVVKPAPDDAHDTVMVLHNMMPASPNGGPLVGRPLWGGDFSDYISAVGRFQLAYNYDRLDGVADLIYIQGGNIYKCTTGVNVTYISAAALAAAGVTLSTTARCHAATLGGKLIVSDGVNVPFMYDGPSNTVTKLTNCPVLYGPLAIYYAKLFGIKASDRETIVWSEENDPTTGYEAGGFNNSWTLGQSGSSPLQCLVGTNQGLFFFRPDSIGWIRGAVTTTFATDGVRDGVSETTGTVTPDSVLLVDNSIYFVDREGRPWVLPIGDRPIPLWKQMQRKFDHATLQNYIYNAAGLSYGDGWVLDLTPAGVGVIMTAFVPSLRLVAFGYQVLYGFGDQGDDPSNPPLTAGPSAGIAYLAMYDHDSGSLQAYWTVPDAGYEGVGGAEYLTSVRMDRDLLSSHTTGETGMLAAIPAPNGVGGQLRFMSLFYPSGSEAFGANSLKAVPQFVISHQLVMSDDTQLAFVRLDVSAIARPGGTVTAQRAQLGAALQTGLLQVSSELAAPLYTDDANLTSGNAGDNTGNAREVQCSYGLNGEGRWARVLLRLIYCFGVTPITGWTLEAKGKTRAPAANTPGT